MRTYHVLYIEPELYGQPEIKDPGNFRYNLKNSTKKTIDVPSERFDIIPIRCVHTDPWGERIQKQPIKEPNTPQFRKSTLPGARIQLRVTNSSMF